tara:strand:- start:239 stop:1204 length:966 start_codon:yes stop_codon:yes gene_type:complete
MKSLSIILLSSFFIISCENSNTNYKPLSSGRLHSVSVVLDKQDWESEIGKTIRDLYADEYLGLPQIEERFSLSQIDYNTFSGFARTGRNIIYINKRKTKGSSITINKYARPQVFLEISGTNQNEIIEQIKFSKQSGVSYFSKGEVVENQRRILQSVLLDSEIEDLFNIELTMPSAYSLFKREENFLWYQKPTKHGTSNVIISELNFLNNIFLNEVVDIRDSISKLYIPGRLEGSYMITEKAYKPFFNQTKINQFDSNETRGTWEVNGDFMGGPFINYIVKDTLNKRMIYLEGFVFSPSERKRDNIIELESIIKSLKVYKKE